MCSPERDFSLKTNCTLFFLREANPKFFKNNKDYENVLYIWAAVIIERGDNRTDNDNDSRYEYDIFRRQSKCKYHDYLRNVPKLKQNMLT